MLGDEIFWKVNGNIGSLFFLEGGREGEDIGSLLSRE